MSGVQTCRIPNKDIVCPCILATFQATEVEIFNIHTNAVHLPVDWSSLLCL